MTTTDIYTTWGSIRGGCGHAHRSLTTARSCLRRDARGCAEQGGWSDRLLRAIASPSEARAYDTERGPGQAISTDEELASGQGE